MLKPTDRPASDRQHVVIIGVGFGGLSAAKEFATEMIDGKALSFGEDLAALKIEA